MCETQRGYVHRDRIVERTRPRALGRKPHNYERQLRASTRHDQLRLWAKAGLRNIPESYEDKEAMQLIGLLLLLHNIRFFRYVARPNPHFWPGFETLVGLLGTLDSELHVPVTPRLFHAIEEMDLGSTYPTAWDEFLPYAATLSRLKSLRLTILLWPDRAQGSDS
jgi:hypothetical protein